jgi:tight adherence protein B
MSAAMLYGGALVLSAWLAARGMTLGTRERLRSRCEIVSEPASADARGGGWRVRRRPALLALGGLSMLGGYLLVGPVGVAAGAATPFVVDRVTLARRRDRLASAVETQLQEAVMAIAAGLRAGLSIRLAVAEARRDAEPPLAQALEEILGRLDLGEPIELALERLRDQLDARDAALVIGVLRIQRRTGGDLPSLLDRVADVIGRRAGEHRHLRALTAQAKVSGAVLAALPVAFIALLSGASGDGLGSFYRSPLGVTLLLSGVILDALGFAWMRRLVRNVERAA